MSTAHRLARDLRSAVNDGARLCRGLPADATCVAAAGRWCARQVLGHLIDSACNNHRRFVIGAASETLVFDGYDQDAWVARGRYTEADWMELVALWEAYNRQLARVIEGLPDAALERQTANHNFERIGWRQVQAGEASTLAHLVDDYIGHLRHHLEQIRSLAAA